MGKPRSMPKCLVKVYPTLELISYTCPAELVVPPNSAYDVNPVSSCAFGLSCGKADTQIVTIKTVIQGMKRFLIVPRPSLFVMLRTRLPEEVGNGY